MDDYEKDRLIKKINEYKLSENILQFVEPYEKIFNRRDRFLWKWLAVVFKESGVTLSTVDKKYFDSVVDNKVILTILISILDDAADFYKDKELMKKICEIIKNNDFIVIDEKDPKIEFVKELWRYLINELKKYPRYEEFKDIFEFDLKQVINAAYHSFLINKKPEMINLEECKISNSFNMIVFLYSDFDLMTSPSFNVNELGNMRAIFWYAQQMARIGNWLSTWKRELNENDISSGVFAYALQKKIININDLKKSNKENIIKRIEESNMKEYFIKLWKENFKEIEKISKNIKSINMDIYLQGLKNVFKFHLLSEGLK